MIHKLSAFAISFIFLSNAVIAQVAEKIIWDDVQRIEFSNDEVPSNLYSEFTGNKKTSFLQYCLPANYSKEKKLVLYCAWHNEYTSASVARKLQKTGFTKVFALKGGWQEWFRAKYPVEEK